jgi:peptidoglycan-associated lipoprotein
MMFTVSCAKKQVDTGAQTPTPAPVAPQPVQQPDTAAAEKAAAEKARLEAERLKAQKERALMKAKSAITGLDIYFDFDSSALLPVAQDMLRLKAEHLRAMPQLSVTIEGHCDERGTDAYNLALGERRAEAVKAFMLNLGISANQMNTISYGEERPISLGKNENSWAKNRRAHFAIN